MISRDKPNEEYSFVERFKRKCGGQLLFKSVTSVFILFFVSYTILYITSPFALRDVIVMAVQPVWRFAGLYQSWKLFAPDVRRFNANMVAVITFENGAITVWQPPRMESLDRAAKFRKWRSREWSIYELTSADTRETWPEFAKYIARLHNSHDCKPVSVMLTVYSANIPTPDNVVRFADLPDHSDFSTAFYYRVAPTDLVVSP